MKLFMTNSDEVFPGLRDTDTSDVNVMECYDRNDGEFNGFFGKKHTEESRKAFRRFGDKNHMYGKKHTEESKQKMKDNHKGTTGMTFTEEHRKKLSEKGKLGWIKRRLTV